MGKKKKTVRPKFFLFLSIVAVLAGGIAFAVSGTGRNDAVQMIADSDISTKEPQVPTEEEKPGAEPETVYPLNGPQIVLDKTVVPVNDAKPEKFGFSSKIEVNRSEVRSYSRNETIRFGHAEDYTDQAGVLTFGGNNYRNSFSYGTVNVANRTMKRAWEQAIGSIGNWAGTGWTGQPLIVRWKDDVRRILGVSDTFKEKDGFTEVIYPAMDGKIYFFELETGTKTRPPIDVGVVMKSTACLDPQGRPVLYVGQSIQQTNPGGKNVAYVFAYSLITNEEIARFGGYDYFGDRSWQGYDGSPLISDDNLIYGGENGVLYTVKLNTSFDSETGNLSLAPERLVKYSYNGSGYSAKDAANSRWLGIESSIAGFENYAYFTDNGGRLQCVDLNKMQLVFVQDVGEDADASVVIDEYAAKDTICLYTASQVKTATLNGNGGYSCHRCFNGLTGELMWERQWIASTGDSNSSGGTIATPQVGRGNVAGLVFYAMNHTALNGAANNGNGYTFGGKLIAYNKLTGDVVWSVEQSAGYYASPVLVYDETNKGYLLQCDQNGKIKLYDAITGNEIVSVDLGSRIDSTPAVFNDCLVVGTRGKGGAGEAAKIICVKIA